MLPNLFDTPPIFFLLPSSCLLSLLEFYQVDNLDNLDLSSDNLDLDLDLIPITRLKCTMSQYQTSPGMPLFFF